MRLNRIFSEIINYLHSIIFSEDFFHGAVKRPADFTRNRKMSFIDYIFAIIKGSKTTLQASIYTFFESQNRKDEKYSKQAYSKGRRRIKPEAFLKLFHATVDKFYEIADTATWRGYHLFGIDGTRLNLPCTEELRKIYGEQTSQGEPQAQALASCLYDLLSGIIIDVRLERCRSSERVAAKDMIEAFDSNKITNPIFVMDRGYPSAELLDYIIHAGHKFVMRCPTEFLRGMKLSKQDTILEHRFSKLKHATKLRIIKVQLATDNVEYLATNLFDSDISAEDFRLLYQKRWGIETKYGDVKNKLEVENFTGVLPEAILQDFYASLLLGNLACVLELDLHDEVEAAHSKPENKYKYRINTNMVISELKRVFIEILITKSQVRKARLFYIMKNRLMTAVVPERPGRKYPRKKRHTASKYPQNMKRP